MQKNNPETSIPSIEETPIAPPTEEKPTEAAPVEPETEFSENWLKKLLIAIVDFLAKLLKKE